MAAFGLMACVVGLGPSEYVAAVDAAQADLCSTEVRQDVAPTAAEAQDRRDYLLLSLATELLPRGHQVIELI